MSRPLPIDPAMPDIVAAVRARSALVLVAEPGAGKTTRVPLALAESGATGPGEVLVVEPRRLAARLAARRVAAELNVPLGGFVGYQVRFDEKACPATRIRYVTEGIASRRLAAGRLDGVAAVVLDEFHERRLESDVILARLQHIRSTSRPDLALVVMSATLEAEPVAEHLGCDVARTGGRPFDVEVEHAERESDEPLHARVAAALRRLVHRGLEGDVLVFLPGAAEIRRAREACAEVARRAGIRIEALHGSLSAAEQDRAVAPARERKVILSTNVAETSVTIEGVWAVVDSGLARVPVHSPWSGLARLETVKVSRASAAQRAGRAGRQRDGLCVRLFTRADHDGRPAHQSPEIQRADLAPLVLALRLDGWADARRFPYFERPSDDALAAAESLLLRLGAVDSRGRLTEVGRSMGRLPLHPRLARLCLEARARGAGRRGAAAAALLSEPEIRLVARGLGRRADADLPPSGPSDVLERVEAFEAAERGGLRREALRARNLDVNGTITVAKARDQILRAMGAEKSASSPDLDEALGMAVVSAFPDRLARRRAPNEPEVVLGRGGSGRLAPWSVVRDADLLVAIEADERARGRTLVTMASAVEAEWLAELYPDELVERTVARFDDARKRVEVVTTVTFEGVTLEESVPRSPDEMEVTRVLVEAALAAGARAFCDLGELETLRARVAFASKHDPRVPLLDDSAVEETIRELCVGRRSFEDVRRVGLIAALEARLGREALAAVSRLAPETVPIPGRRRVRVSYPAAGPPFISSRLQDFFGGRVGPAVAAGREPLVLHLLAPNGRDVQVTTDLAGFWERHYPKIRRELMRRYPKHDWPEDPLGAAPRQPGARRRHQKRK